MSEKPIIAIVSITITTLAGFHVGLPYVGSLIGNIVYLFSVLFLIGFVLANIFHIQKIEDLSKGKLYFICIVYLLAIPLIYLINSFKPPSIFLICLFFLYFFLTLVWAFIVEKRRLTDVCIGLIILCLLPLTLGLCVQRIYEDPICDGIKYLENQKEYYENRIGDLNYGILTQDRTNSAKNDVREIEKNIEEAKECYLVADFSGALKRIETANKSNSNFKRTFELLDPKKYLPDELRGLDEDLVQLNSRASDRVFGMRGKITDSEYTHKTERILSDINITKKKSDEAWDLYRNGSYEETYKCTVQIKRDISDIEERLDRIRIVSEMRTHGMPYGGGGSLLLLVFAIALLLVAAYLITRRK